MNKRLRKKKHRGEFKEVGFDFKICFTPFFDNEKRFELIDNIYWLIEQHGFIAGAAVMKAAVMVLCRCIVGKSMQMR